MELKEILKKVDHTLLSPTATKADIRNLCDEAMEFSCASVCVPPSYVEFARNYIDSHKSDVKVCTVVGFPNGYNTTTTKFHEAVDAVADGADEIDMVVNLGWVKDGEFEKVEDEIGFIKDGIGDKVLKVIVETAVLTIDELIALCDVVNDSGADYIKTSTGFSTRGASVYDVEVMSRNVEGNVKIKAAGGISSIEDAEKLIEAGASRLGTSKLVKIAKSLKA